MAEAIRVKLDKVEDLSAEEVDGVVLSVSRRALVTSVSEVLDKRDYTVLIASLERAGVPQPGARLPGVPDVYLRRRVVKVHEGDPRFVTVDLEYSASTGEGQNLTTPPYGIVVNTSQSTVAQKETNKDFEGNVIQVGYDYPSTPPVDVELPSDYREEYAGQIKWSTGPVQVYQAQGCLRVVGIQKLTMPWQIRQAMEGSINATAWFGGVEHTWMCMSVGTELHGMVPARYKMTYEFQYNPDGWDQTVYFKDDLTGVATVNFADQSIAVKTVQVQPAVNFEAIMGFRILGV